MKKWLIILLIRIGVLIVAGIIMLMDTEYFENAKPAYPAGESVMIYYDLIATDTDYTFLLDGEPLNYGFDESKGFVISFMPIRVRSLRIEGTNPIADAGHILMGQDRGLYAETIQSPGHDHKGPVAALRRFVAEGLVKLQKLPEGRPFAYVHTGEDYSVIVLHNVFNRVFLIISFNELFASIGFKAG